jgi:predicted dehydrogenase
MDRLRIGLVGGGPWARQVHLAAISAHPRLRLGGIWTRRPEVAAELADRFGTQAAAGPDELFDAVDVVAFAVPPRVQGELAVRAAGAGRHLVCEKPLADTLPAARAVVDAVRAADVYSSLVLTLRHDRSVQAWLAGLPAAPAGPDSTGSARWLSGALLGGPYAGSSWRAEHGALLDLGPHVLDLLDAALGPIRSVDWAFHDEPDLWRLGVTHSGGARSTATLSMRMPIDPSEIEFAVFGRPGAHRVGRAADGVASFTRLLDELVAAIDGTGPPPALDAARGLWLQELIDQVRAVARPSSAVPDPAPTGADGTLAR